MILQFSCSIHPQTLVALRVVRVFKLEENSWREAVLDHFCVSDGHFQGYREMCRNPTDQEIGDMLGRCAHLQKLADLLWAMLLVLSSPQISIEHLCAEQRESGFPQKQKYLGLTGVSYGAVCAKNDLKDPGLQAHGQLP